MVNGPGRHKLGQEINSWQWAKHAWLYPDVLQVLNTFQLWVLKFKSGCFASTETISIRTVRDGEPRTATSTFTRLLVSEKGF